MRPLLSKLAFLFLLLLFSGEAQAHFFLTGLADLEYTKFEETNKGKNMSATQFQQKYEIGANAGGYILDTGFGDYALSLRYQSLDSDSTIDSESIQASGQKWILDGQINLHPADYPWKLRAYYNNSTPLFPVTKRIPNARASFAPLVVREVEGGGMRTYGFSFEYDGSRVQETEEEMLQYLQSLKDQKKKALNSEELRKMYLRERELSGYQPKKPAIKLYLDYKSMEVDRSEIRERTEELKFSLNEGKNWLHYDRTRYDNLNGGGEYTEEGFQIGNVARDGRREWFHVSNWTLMSVDAQYLRRDTEDVKGASDTYSLNLFANAFRSTWDAYLYGSYSQTLNNETYAGAYQLSLPLYLVSKPAQDVVITNKFSYREWEKWTLDRPRDPYQGGYFQGTPQEFEDWKAGKPIPGETIEQKQELAEDIILTHLNLPAKDLTFKPRLTIVNLSGMGDGDSTANTLSYSIESNPAKSYSYGLNYTFTRVRDDDGEDISDDLTSHTFSVNGRYAVTQRVGISGSYTSNQAEDADRLPTADYRSDSIDLGANLYLYRTLSIDIRGSRKWTNNSGASQEETRTYTGNVRFTPAAWLKATSTQLYTEEKESIGGMGYGAKDRSSYSTSNLMEIRVNRSFSSRTRFDYLQEEDAIARARTLTRSIEEGFEYTRLTNGYRARTLFSFLGSGNYCESKSYNSYTNSKGTTFGLNYYPSLYMSLGLSARYGVGSGGDTTKGGSAYIAFPFPSLNISASYGYEAREGAKEDYVANKVSVKVSKIF